MNANCKGFDSFISFDVLFAFILMFAETGRVFSHYCTIQNTDTEDALMGTKMNAQ